MSSNTTHLPYTIYIERLAKTLQVPEAVALDIDYLDRLRERIINASHRNPALRDFPVTNEILEKALDELEKE